MREIKVKILEKAGIENTNKYKVFSYEELEDFFDEMANNSQLYEWFEEALEGMEIIEVEHEGRLYYVSIHDLKNGSGEK